MADILADYRIWKSQQEERIGTHSKRCHLWPRHERCMIHRLATELEKVRGYRDLLEADLSIAMLAATRNGNLSACETVRSREAVRRLAEQNATLSVCDGNVTVTMDATLTDAEREAVAWFANYGYSHDGVPGRMAATLRGLLERLGGGLR